MYFRENPSESTLEKFQTTNTMRNAENETLQFNNYTKKLIPEGWFFIFESLQYFLTADWKPGFVSAKTFLKVLLRSSKPSTPWGSSVTSRSSSTLYPKNPILELIFWIWTGSYIFWQQTGKWLSCRPKPFQKYSLGVPNHHHYEDRPHRVVLVQPFNEKIWSWSWFS